ncbi:DnaJ-domain-containing protein [Backusella circina FSU 941]|nr:DnaJ-domain-containing protein [Backusella circina FSU 941]
MSKTPYEVLGVGRYSSQKEIRQRYLELCKKHHPDVASKGSMMNFTEITTAYEFLSNKRTLQRIQQQQPRYHNSTSAHFKPIDTKVWTRRSLIIGLGFAAFMAYSFSADSDEPVVSIPPPPHQLGSSVDNKGHPATDATTNQPPWQAAGISFREWRKG